MKKRILSLFLVTFFIIGCINIGYVTPIKASNVTEICSTDFLSTCPEWFKVKVNGTKLSIIYHCEDSNYEAGIYIDDKTVTTGSFDSNDEFYAEIETSTYSDGFHNVKFNNYAGRAISCYDLCFSFEKKSNEIDLHSIDSDDEIDFYSDLNKNYKPDDFVGFPVYYYDCSLEDKKTMDEIVNKAIEITKACKTDEEKVKKIHDWIATNIAYDFENYYTGTYYDSADPIWVFKNKRAVCSGYSRLAKIMFSAIGIPCLCIVGTATTNSGEEPHEWNAVYINDSWKYIDITWDSQNVYGTKIGDETYNILNQEPLYSYYGISPELISEKHKSSMVDYVDSGAVVGIEPYYVDTIYELGDSFERADEWEYVLSNNDKYYSYSDYPMSSEMEKNVVYSGYDLSKSGKQTVTAKFYDFTYSYDIYVMDTNSNNNQNTDKTEDNTNNNNTNNNNNNQTENKKEDNIITVESIGRPDYSGDFDATAYMYGHLNLPDTVKVTWSDGSVTDESVIWGRDNYNMYEVSEAGFSYNYDDNNNIIDCKFDVVGYVYIKGEKKTTYAHVMLVNNDLDDNYDSDNKVIISTEYQGYTFKYSPYSDDTRCYDSSGKPVINEFKCDGTYTYYFQADGTAMKDRLTYHPDGVHVIYFDSEGHEVFSDFANVRKTIAGDEVNDFCFFDVFGYMYVDVLTYDKTGSVLYYANPYGVMEMGKWFQFSDTVMWADGTPAEGIAGGYGYANEDGTLMTNTQTIDWEGRSCYLQGNGVALY